MDKRKKIIGAAINLFVKNGFEGSPTSKIAKDAGVAEGTIFRYFKNKIELINQAYLSVKEDIAKHIYDGKKRDEKQTMRYTWIQLMKWGFNNQIESRFFEMYYGSKYINDTTIEESSSKYKPGFDAYLSAKKKGIIRDIPLFLYRHITFNMYHAFSKEFPRMKRLSPKFLKLSFEMYWNAIKK